MIEHYWCLCYPWHIHIMSINDVNTQTRFMVLFTSRSLLTWGKLLDASSGISPRYLSTIYSQLTISPFFYRHPIIDRLCLFFSRGGQVGEGDGLNMGESNHLPPTATVSHTLPYPSRTVLCYQPQGLGREAENMPHHLPVSTSYRGQEIWSIDHMGKPLSGQGPLHGGSN